MKEKRRTVEKGSSSKDERNISHGVEVSKEEEIRQLESIVSSIPKEKNALFRQLDEKSRKEFIAELLKQRKAEESKNDQEKSREDSPESSFVKRKHLAKRKAVNTSDSESQPSDGPPTLVDDSSLSETKNLELHVKPLQRQRVEVIQESA